ncbi:397_t:CDS:2, partial [Acaulospora morrowiae]
MSGPPAALNFTCFWSNALANPTAVWYAFLFYISLGAYIGPNTVVTTRPTAEQTRLYRARVAFSVNLAFFLVAYFSVFSYFHTEVALVLAVFSIPFIQDIGNAPISDSVYFDFTSRLAARLGVPVSTSVSAAAPAHFPASTPIPSAPAIPVSAASATAASAISALSSYYRLTVCTLW